MPSPITEQAIRIIDAAPAHGPLQPADYASALPPEAGALARVLAEARIADAAAKYGEADAAAAPAQTRFRWLGEASAYTGFAAAALGGVLLYVGSDSAHDALRSNLGLGQFVLLAISILCALLLFVLKPYRTWRAERGNAEALRLRIFALLMAGEDEAREDELPLLPLQLECFRRHLVEDQRRFFARRGPQQRRTVIVWKIVGVVSILLVLAASLPQVLRLGTVGLLPAFLRDLIGSIPLDQKGYALAGLLGGSLQGLLAALAVISPAQRNAEKYRTMCQRLGEYAGDRLADARAAATVPNRAAVHEFATGVSDELAEEAREWLLLQQVLSEMTLGRLSQQRKA